MAKKILTGELFAPLDNLLPVRKNHEGGILIEFTFAVPVCITLLFFINDHYRFLELRNKVKASAYLAASMVQNITNTRSDKQITKQDLARIAYASGLNFFHTNSMFAPYPLGVYYMVYFSYVKRISSNEYQISDSFWSSLVTTHEAKLGYSAVMTKTKDYVQKVPELVCQNDGEEKLAIHCTYRIENKNLGFLIRQPKSFPFSTPFVGSSASFVGKVVITPKPGLFPPK